MVDNSSVDSQNTLTCTWCRGTGFIRRKFDFTKTNWLRCILILIFIVSLAVINKFQSLSGNAGMWFLGAIGIVFLFTFVLDVYEFIKFFSGSKVACPHCAVNVNSSGNAQ